MGAVMGQNVEIQDTGQGRAGQGGDVDIVGQEGSQ